MTGGGRWAWQRLGAIRSHRFGQHQNGASASRGPALRAHKCTANAGVMAVARVFTGWRWGFPDTQLTEQNFR